MKRINLADIARDNEAALAQSYNDMLLAHPCADRVRELHDACESAWTVSINCWAFQLNFFLDQGIPYNKYRYVQHREGGVMLPEGDRVAGDSSVDWDRFWEVLHRNPQDAGYAPRRRVFNMAIDQEEEFSYCAYHVEGGGAESFGQFTLLLNRETVQAMSALSFLRHDSLQHYVEQGNASSGAWTLNRKRLHEDAATAWTVTRLMCLKLGKQMEALDAEACKKLISTKDDYIEGQIAEPFGHSAIDQVRVKSPSHALLRLLSQLSVQQKLDAEDADLTDDEREARDFHLAIEGIQSKRVPISYI